MTMKIGHAPNCKKCRKDGVEADAGLLTSKPYYYCRICKIELDFWGHEVYPEKRSSANSVAELESYLKDHPELIGIDLDEEWPMDRSEDDSGYGWMLGSPPYPFCLD